MIQTLVFLPALAALITGLGGRWLGVRPSQMITTGAVMAAAVLSWITFFNVALGGQPVNVTVLEWVTSGDLSFNWAFKVDTLTAVMLVVVNTVSALVHLYSVGYMAEDPHQPRFFAYLSLFTFAMLMLVTADNLVQMFFGWEGVGLASYLLIGFWYHKPSANAAAIKAFVVNRVGDFGFGLGIFATFMVFGTVSFDAIFAATPAMAGKTFLFLGYKVDILTTIALLLFIGAMGKSAQLGLHTWLPDAMEGPTPVSALIHAATMVTAGVFMVARTSPIFEHALPVALNTVTIVGASTAFFAATIGTCQNDIKRVIAYSTCSQLGYMFFALGVGAHGAAIFHLFTHAFFKALLFLGAGSVIHAMHHEQDMRFYGGLARKIPVTFAVMTIGTLAITGVPLFAGYYSKDAILEAAFMAHTGVGEYAFVLGVSAALLTSFYSWRLVFLTFFGAPRWAASEHIQHAMHPAGGHGDHGHAAHAHAHDAHHDDHADGTAGYKPHESPFVMLVPLVVLATGAVLAGLLFHEHFIGHDRAAFWNGALAVVGADVLDAIHHIPALPKWLPTLAMLTGLAVAFLAYIRDPSLPGRFVAHFQGLHAFLFNKWYFDELYDFLFVRPAQWLGRFFWKQGDGRVIDGFGPDGVSALVAKLSYRARRLQTGYLYHYAFAMLIGVAIAATWASGKLFGG